MKAPVVHVWSPMYEHEPAYVVGNRDGLTALLAAIVTALDQNENAETTVFNADGEGYDLIVGLVDDTDRLALPYTGDGSRDDEEDWGRTILGGKQ